MAAKKPIGVISIGSNYLPEPLFLPMSWPDTQWIRRLSNPTAFVAAWP